ncbi:hypothetical protein G6F63_013318 [Rhizopus arrhizus]|nr:hypothetical protein G6F63_013318 [Rhizopus arrhizus]
MAGRAVVLRIEPPAASRPCRASIVPSLRSADASGPASSFGPARPAPVCHQGAQGRVLGCACGPHPPCARFLDGPRPRAPLAAGDELRKDGGNEANRVPRADRTEQPKGWAPNLGIRCALSSTAKSGERHACNPFRFPFPRTAQRLPAVR